MTLTEVEQIVDRTAIREQELMNDESRDVEWGVIGDSKEEEVEEEKPAEFRKCALCRVEGPAEIFYKETFCCRECVESMSNGFRTWLDRRTK